MIIVVNNWKRKLKSFCIILFAIVVFGATLPVLSNIINNQVPVVSTWVKDEHPSGNPMRVEKEEDKSKYDQVLDNIVLKLQNFYYND